MAPCAADTASLTCRRKSGTSPRQPLSVPVATGRLRQEAGTDEVGAGAAGAVGVAVGPARGGEAGEGAEAVDPHAAMRMAASGFRKRAVRGKVKTKEDILHHK